MIGKFFHLPRSKQFDIPYRYYDPDKEDMEAREQRIKREMGIQDEKDNSNYRASLKGSFRTSMGRDSKTMEDARRKSNKRLIIIILALALLFYLVLFKF